MQQQKTQNNYFPVRVRIRPSTKSYSSSLLKQPDTNGHEQTTPLSSTIEKTHESQRQTQQIKELLCLGNLLRADLSLNEVLHRIAASISNCTGFRILVVNLIEEGKEYTRPVAFAGVSEEGEQIIRANPVSLEHMHRLMQPEFRISQSYFISHEHQDVFAGITVVRPDIAVQENVRDAWHPEDFLLIPLVSPRAQKLLGFLSLDSPEDEKIPTLEGIEVVELFAQQAAIAIDNANIFQDSVGEIPIDVRN